MNRSIWKLPRIIFNVPRENTLLSTYLRNAVIAPKDIGTVIKIHNGCKFVHIRITEHLVGYKFGAFAQTKRRVYHKQKKKKK